MPRKTSSDNSSKKKTVKNSKAKGQTIEAQTDAAETDNARKEILDIISQENIKADEPKEKQKMKPVKEPVKESPKVPIEAKAANQVSVGRKVGLIVLAAVIVLVLAIGAFGIGLYGYGWDDEKITQKVVQVIPYPAAIVQNNPVTFNQYFKDLNALEQYYQKQYELNPEAVTLPTKEELQKVIMDKLIRDKILMHDVNEANLNVTNDEVDAELATVIAESGGEETLTSSLDELYGWTIDDFTDSILKIYLAREKMQQKLSFDESLPYNQEAKQRIEEVSQKLNQGQIDFKEAASKYSEDLTASTGGNLGFMAENELEDNFARVAFSLQEGETSDVVHTVYGYHIIKVDEVIMGVDSEGEPTSNGEERRNLSHILIKTKDLDEWLNEQLNDAKVYNFVQ